MNKEITARAFMYSYNEADIIFWTVKHVVEQGLLIHVSDNWSTDGTFELLQKMAAEDPRITLTRWPYEPTSQVSWKTMLERVEELALIGGTDWCVHYDADEIRRSMVPCEKLIEFISRMDSLGFNAIDHYVKVYEPREGYDGSQNPEEYLNYEKPGHHIDKKNGQVKCWKQPAGIRVNLATSGGHKVDFPGIRIAPERLILQHYPLRSPKQMADKLKSRKERWTASDRAMKWHVQYEGLT